MNFNLNWLNLALTLKPTIGLHGISKHFTLSHTFR
jgi:hypothetical protein